MSLLRPLARAIPLLLLLALPASPRAAHAATLFGPKAPSAYALGITFSPYGGTFYAAAKTVRIGWCDTVNGTRKVKWNGVLLAGTFPGTSSTDPSCSGAYRYSDVSLTMVAGNNTLWAEACDGDGICFTESAVFTYLTTDATRPSAQISPASHATSSGTVTDTITWCDDNAFGTGRRIKLNGTDVTTSFNFVSGTGDPGTSCNVRSTSMGTVALAGGVNTVTAEIHDVAGNWGPLPVASVTYTHHPTIDTSPTNQFSLDPQIFDATLSYSTPSYRSLDQDRSVTLVYSSIRARPTVTLQVDVANNSSPAAPVMSLGLRWNGVMQTLPDNRTELHYTTAAGANRLTAFYGASSTATGSMNMQAVVKRHYTTGTITDTVPVRVLVVNDGASAFGAGWSVVGVERVVPTTGGILVTHGDATATFYPAYTGCSLINGINACAYGHSPGDFGTMTYQPDSLRYVRTGRDGTKTYFDAVGQITRVHNRMADTVRYAWSSGRLSSITDPAGKVTTFAYDAAGKLASITDPTGRVSTFVVNASGDLVTITDPDAVTTQMTYLSTHRLASYTDRAGGTTNLTYDVFGKLATVQSPSFTAEGGQTFRQTTSFTSLAMAAQGSTTGGTPGSPFPRVDPLTLRASVTDPQGRVTRLAFDPWGSPSRVEDPVGYASANDRNAEGQVTLSVDARGNATTYAWTGGDLTSVTDASGTVTMVYDTTGAVTDVTSPTGTVKNWYGAATGLLDSTVVAGTDTSRYTYDARGRVLTASDPERHVTTYDYTDASGWQWKNTRSVTSGGRTSWYTYDAYGRVAGATNPDGRETTFQYDLLNRQRYVTTPDAGVTEYVWGALFLDRVTDARGQSYQWTRNAMGWVEREVRPGDLTGVNLTAAYDRYGRTTSSTDRRGRQVSVTYDTQDRVVTRTADLATTTFAFSPDQPTNPTAPSWVAASNAESTDTVQVDGRGRVTSSVSRRSLAGGVQRFELLPRYDANDRPVGLVVLQPTGVRDSIGYTYNSTTALLQSMRDMAAGTTTFAFNRDGVPTQTTLPNSHVVSYAHTSTHMPRSIRYGTIGVDNVAGMEYDYDVLNRIRSWIRPNYSRDREFDYDQNGGWLSAYSDYVQNGSTHPTCTPDPDNGMVCTDPSAIMTYTGGDSFAYDLTGNPTDHGAVLGVANRLTQFNGYTLAYDSTGNLVSKTRSGFTQTFTWNALGQLASVTTNGVTVTYGYDGMGKRVRRQVGGVDTGYLYDGDNLLLEYDVNGVQAKYTHYPGSSVPHSVVRGGQTYYYATDVQGSVLALFNSSNTVVNQYAYLPFGDAQGTPTETVTNRIRFAGRELESESGLYYNNARWYDPQLHRFVSEDPIGIDGGLNLYAYVANDPVNATDPSGLMGCTRLPAGIGNLQNSKSGPYSGPYFFFWECDWWGMPIQTLAEMRFEYAEKCTWHWHCPGDAQDEWAEHSSCRMAGCELRQARPEERQFVVTRLSTLRRNDDFCRRLSAAGLGMAERQLGIFENNVSYVDHGVTTYIWGNAPINERLGGPVMYLYKNRMYRNGGKNVVHEAVHGLLDPKLSLPTYYGDYSTTEIGLSVDESASYCMGMRGR